MKNTVSFPKLNISFTLDRIAFKIGNFNIYWYGIIIALGLVLAAWYVTYLSKKTGKDKEVFIDLLIYAIPVSVICARAYYVAFEFDSYKNNILSIFYIHNGGIAIYGAIIGAVLTAVIYFKVKKLPVLEYLDIGVLGLLIGQAIGRWGNFVNCEAYGSPTNCFLGMSINGFSPVHPAFLYESLWNVLGFAILCAFFKKRKFNGATFLSYIMWYGAGRFFIEGLRADSLYIGNFRVSQVIAGVSVIVAFLIYIIASKKKC